VTGAHSEKKPMKKYPPANQVDVVDDLHGTKVPDPYRWLEYPDSADTKAWVRAQNAVTFGRLEKVPVRGQLRERLTTLGNYERFGSPFVEGKGKDRRFFYWKNDGLQNQAVLWVANNEAATPRILLDPNTLSEDGTTALSSMDISHDGKKMAYSLSQGGS